MNTGTASSGWGVVLVAVGGSVGTLCRHLLDRLAHTFMPDLPVGTFLPAIFARDFGLSLGVIGAIFLAGRLWDGLLDPIVGALSDRTRTRFGRRKPWIAGGGALFALASILLFFPIGQVSAAYLSVVLFVFYLGWTAVQIPFLAWSGEISGQYHERTRIATYQTVIGAAGLGNTLGIGIGNLLRAVKPPIVVITVLLADTAAAILCALLYGLLTAVILGLTAGICQGLGKLALDATIQAEVPERSRTSAFARSETLLQLSWVIGGFIGIALPQKAALGLWILAAIMVGWAFFTLSHIRGRSAVD